MQAPRALHFHRASTARQPMARRAAARRAAMRGTKAGVSAAQAA